MPVIKSKNLASSKIWKHLKNQIHCLKTTFIFRKFPLPSFSQDFTYRFPFFSQSRFPPLFFWNPKKQNFLVKKISPTTNNKIFPHRAHKQKFKTIKITKFEVFQSNFFHFFSSKVEKLIFHQDIFNACFEKNQINNNTHYSNIFILCKHKG